MIKKTVLILLVALTFSCNRGSKHENSFQLVFKHIESLSIKKQELDWNKIKRDVRDSIKEFKSYDDLYASIEYTLKLMNDRHSVFLRPKKNFFLSDTVKIDIDTFRIPNVESKIIGKNIGYLKIIGFTPPTPELAKLYTLKIRKELMKLDSLPNLSGFIVDLSNNTGGFAFSQPLALSPLFNDSIVAYEANNKGEFYEIICSNNEYRNKANKRVISLDYENKLIHKNKKIAVLISEKTSSSGEFVSLILKSQENSRLFGTETNGLTTSLEQIKFSNGAALFLAQANWYDRNKNLIKGGIKPDIQCPKEKSLELAIEWVQNDI